MKILSNLSVSGLLGLNSVSDANTDTDKFLVLDSSGIVRYRTGAELFSDIGAGGAAAYTSVLQHTVKAGVALTKGQAVYVTSADGTNMIVGKASNTSEATSSKTLGLVVQDLALNAQGFVITEGLLAGLDTSTAVAGDPVWLGTDGNLIFGLANKPYAPTHLVFIGIVTRVQQNNGEIFVKVQNGFELQELHNVQITSTPSDNTVLAYETSTSLYKMKSIPTLLGYTPTTNARNITINGTTYDLSADRSWSVGTHTGNLTTGYVPKATGATTLTDSLIYDNGSAIGINTASPYESSVFKLDVNGGVIIKNTNGTTAQLILINSNPASGGNNGFVQLTAGGTTSTTFAQWQTYYGMSVAAGALRLQPAGGQVLIGTSTASAFLTDINGTLRVSGQLTLGSTISNNTYVYTMPGATGTLALLSDIPSLSGYLTISSAAATYLTQSNAAATYLTQTSASNTYLTISGAASTYLSQANASNTYLTISGASSIYLSQTNASNTYLTINGASITYLSQTSASNTYLTINNAASTYVSLSGSYANPSWITSLAWSKITGAPAFLTSYTETDTLASVTARGASTSTAITLNTGGNIVSTSTWEKWKLVTTGVTAPARQGSDANGLNFTSNALWNSGWSQDDSTKKSMAYIQHLGNGRHEFRTSPSGGTITWTTGLTIDEAGANFNIPLTISSNTVYHAGNLTNLSQLSNGPGYITGYTEIDTLASVTGRGSSTSNPIYIDQTTGGGYVFRTSSSWGGWARNAFTISDGSNNLLVTLGGYGGSGTSLSYAYIGLAYNNNWITFSSSAVNSQVALQQSGNQVLHAGNYSSYALPLSGGTLTGPVVLNDSSYFRGSSTYGFRFNNNADTLNLMSVRAAGDMYVRGQVYVGGDGFSSGTQLVYNSGTWGISITGNSATLGGYGPNQTGGAYTIVQRDANGYIQNSYFYMSGGGSERNSSGLGYIAGFNSSDYYVRSYNSTAVASFLGLGSMAYASTGSYLALSGGTMSGQILTPSVGTGTYDGAIQIRETGYASNGQSAWGYSPAITFHWGNRYAKRFGMRSDGLFAVDDQPIVIQNGGTWGISITGNADTVDGYHASGLLKLNEWNGNLYLHTDGRIYGTIFYDANDSGYYVDPNSTSLLNYVRVANQFYVGNGSQININYDQIWRPDGGQIHIGYSAANNIQLNNGGGYTYSLTSLRAPIFYDYNDTGYYGDFAGTSRLNVLNIVDSQYIGGQTVNGQSHYQWEGATYRNPGQYTAGLIVRRDNATTGLDGSYPALVLYNNDGRDQSTVAMSFATMESNSGGNAVPLGGIIAKKSIAGNNGGWSSGSLTFYVKDLGTRRDALTMSTNGNLSTSYTMYAAAFRGNANVAGTGEAVYAPAGIYSTGTNWLYGTMYLNNNSLNDVYQISHTNASIKLYGNFHLDAYNGNTIYLQYYNQGATIQSYASIAMNNYSISNLNTVTANGSITSSAYIYAGYSMRMGEIWGYGGVYRSSGDMMFGTENAGWRFHYQNVQKVYIGTDGNIWMAWAGDYISNLLSAKMSTSSYPYAANMNQYVRTTDDVYFNSVRAGLRAASGMVGYGGGDWTSDFANTPTSSMTFGQDKYSGGPSGTWWFQVNMRHNNGSNLWGTQLAYGWEDNANEIYQRNVTGGNWSGWVRYLNSNNSPYAYNMDQYVRSTSSPTFNTLYLGGTLRNNGDVSDDDNFGIYWGSSAPTSYAIYREAGSWSWPYPDLRIAFHTGIKIGANTGYGGIRFYSDYDMSTIVASINDGDNNMRGYYDIIAYASDRRLKHNIKPIENALSKVNSLTGMTYEWNSVGNQYGWNPSSEREAGVFAQDVQAVLPEAVKLAPFDQGYNQSGDSYSKSGQNFLTVKYEKIVPLLIEAIKEQQKQIEDLKGQLNGITK